MLIDQHNIEELIFYDKKLFKQLPDLQYLYNQWLLGKQSPALKFLSKKSVLEMLEKLDTSKYLIILEEYFNEKVSLKPINYHVVKNYTISIELLQETLDKFDRSANIAISIDDMQCYISNWR